jgi:hypothetical protein
MARLRFVPSIRALSLPLQGLPQDNSYLAPDSGKAAEKIELKLQVFAVPWFRHRAPPAYPADYSQVCLFCAAGIPIAPMVPKSA